jgi:hypothetical protein
MPLSGTGQRVTHRHPAGAYVYVIEGNVEFVLGDGERATAHDRV